MPARWSRPQDLGSYAGSRGTPAGSQPYYDVRKLIEKDNVSVNSTEGTYITCALVFTLIAGGIFFSGGNLLMSVFVITLSGLFFIVAAVLHALAVRRDRREPRDAAGHGVRAHGAVHGRGVLHGGRNLQLRRRVLPRRARSD